MNAPNTPPSKAANQQPRRFTSPLKPPKPLQKSEVRSRSLQPCSSPPPPKAAFNSTSPSGRQTSPTNESSLTKTASQLRPNPYATRPLRFSSSKSTVSSFNSGGAYSTLRSPTSNALWVPQQQCKPLLGAAGGNRLRKPNIIRSSTESLSHSSPGAPQHRLPMMSTGKITSAKLEKCERSYNFVTDKGRHTTQSQQDIIPLVDRRKCVSAERERSFSEHTTAATNAECRAALGSEVDGKKERKKRKEEQKRRKGGIRADKDRGESRRRLRSATTNLALPSSPRGVANDNLAVSEDGATTGEPNQNLLKPLPLTNLRRTSFLEARRMSIRRHMISEFSVEHDPHDDLDSPVFRPFKAEECLSLALRSRFPSEGDGSKDEEESEDEECTSEMDSPLHDPASLREGKTPESVASDVS